MDYVLIGVAILGGLWGIKAYIESRENKKLAAQLFDQNSESSSKEVNLDEQTQFEMEFEATEPDSELTEEPAQNPEKNKERVSLEPDLIVVQLMSRPNKVFQGLDLNRVLSGSPLAFNSAKGVYEYFEVDNKNPALIVVNQEAPGAFPEKMGTEFTTHGMSFLLPLPAPVDSNSQLFETLLGMIQTMNESLDGLICNDKGRLLTEHQLEQLQEKVKAYDA